MVARFLVTTALEDTWPADDVPVLFLGEWCRRYDRKTAWKKRDAVVAAYHWDDRQKLYKDYLYLQALYEELLKELAAQLNELHRVDHSLRYWRIIVGPWLGYFVQMLFDRWEMLRQVVRENNISDVRVLRRNGRHLVPNDMASFTSLFVGDAWNESIYGQILDWMGVPVERIDAINSEHVLPCNDFKIHSSSRLKSSLARVASHISGIFCRDAENFFISTYLGVKQEMLLQVKLGQLPKLWRSVAVPISLFDCTARKWQMPTLRSNDDFSVLVRALIPTKIPMAYLEGYQKLDNLTESLPWPKRPKAIFTSNSFNSDDVFKVWAARRVESGTPMLIGQHGGNYGMALWNFNEDHQIAIADQFLTWGWSESAQNKITPVGNLKGFGRRNISDKARDALLVEMTIPRQSYHMFSVPVSVGQWLDYFEEQCRFVQALPESLRKHLLVRLNSQDFGCDQRQRWQSHLPEIRLDEGARPMVTLLKKARLYISTYNATTYLESMSINFPTIIFWNPEFWELRDSALPYFEKLKSVGIFHETPESAARQMAMVWDDVSAWWQSAEVQSVRQEFCEQYARSPEKCLDVLEKIFCNINDRKKSSMDLPPSNGSVQ